MYSELLQETTDSKAKKEKYTLELQTSRGTILQANRKKAKKKNKKKMMMMMKRKKEREGIQKRRSEEKRKRESGVKMLILRES